MKLILKIVFLIISITIVALKIEGKYMAEFNEKEVIGIKNSSKNKIALLRNDLKKYFSTTE